MMKIAFGFALLAFVVAAVWLLISRSSTERPELMPSAMATDIQGPALPAGATASERENWFWQVVEASRRDAVSKEAQSARLSQLLGSYSPEEIEVFAAELDRLKDGAYSWDLWGAAYVIMGGCSDDGFADFRSWLISNGREFFEAASKEPETLAELIPQSTTVAPEYEEFAYIAAETWAAKTGRSFSEMPRTTTQAYVDGPTGEPFEEDEASLSERYPALWRRFGNSPLG